MTLLPIIYTSLMIFSGFLLFVIMISYISYKLKGGRNQLRHFNQLEPQPIIAPAPIRRIPSVPVTPRVNFPEYPSNHQSVTHRNTSLQIKPELNKQLVKNDTRVTEQIRKTAAPKGNGYEKKSRNHNQTRLEIMNTSEKYSQHPLTIEIPARHIRTAQSLSDANILNYYSDRSDKGFVSLRAV